MRRELDRLSLGVPYHQQLATHEGNVHDNFYLFRLKVVSLNQRHLEEELSFHVFTTKEIQTAVHRYENDMNELPYVKRNNIVGYVYPTTYHNPNGVLTTRYLLKFDCSNVVGLENNVLTGLFTAREMRRSRDRVEMYIRPSLMTRMWKGIKWILQKVRHF